MPARRPAPSRARDRRIPLAAATAVAVVLVGAGITTATAAPFTPAYPTVYISQMIGGSTTTTMRQAMQSRLANAGAGGVEIASIGSAASFAYNATGFRVADGYIYGVSSDRQLVRVEDDGTATRLGTITGLSAAMYSGTFGQGAHADNFFVRPTNSSTAMFVVDVPTRAVTQSITLTEAVTVNDFTWKDGYLWGVEGATKAVVRISPAGAVTKFATSGVFPAADTGSTGYGAAWTYGNGNLAFSHNDTGNITQISVTNPGTASPTITLVSTIQGPPTSQNDGTTSPSSPADLELDVTQPEPAAPSSPIGWEIEIVNNGPGGSSGGTFSFPVPDGVTGVVVPVGCTLTSGVVQCVTDPLPDGATDTYVFSAVSPPAGSTSATSTITLVGNEEDPVDQPAQIVITPLPTHLTSTGVGTTPQSPATPVVIPSGGSVTLLDADGDPAASVTVPGQGTYTLDPGTGVLTFTPVLGFVGEATPVDFFVTGPSGTTTGTYTPTVLTPAAPSATPLASTGTGTTAQQVTAAIPTGGTVTLLDGGTPATTVPVPGQGSYVLDAVTGEIVFTPVLGFAGEATPVPYRVTDAYGQTASSTYTPTVLAPAGPSATPLTTTGTSPDAQVTTASVPADSAITLLDGGGNPTTTVTVPGQGTYTLDPATGQITFTPADLYVGTATPVTYRVTDAYGQTASSTYTPTVLAPAGPSATPLTSTGTGTATQQVTAAIPSGGAVTLLDGGGNPTATVTVPGQGTYTLDPATGQITFAPVLGFTGAATPVDYRVTDPYGQTASATYTPTVLAPAPPGTPDVNSTGPVVTAQGVTVTIPTGGSVTLLDGDGNPATTVTIPGVGSYVLDPATGQIVFTPVFGFAGTPPTVDYEVTDAYGQTSVGTYTPQVIPPTPPTAELRTTTGTGTAAQDTAIAIPVGGSAALLDADGDPALVVVVPGEGTYTLDPDSGQVTFVPELGFAGEADGVPYQVTDAYGQQATGQYVPTVVAPAPPVAEPLTSTGSAGTPQSPEVVITVPEGGSVTLVDADGNPTLVVTVPGQGTYTLDPQTGVLTFEPEDGFHGTADPVTYRITDAYGQESEGTYTATVDAPAPDPEPEGPGEPTTSGPAPEGDLAVTGSSVLGLGLVAAGLMLLGAVLVVVRRRPTEA